MSKVRDGILKAVRLKKKTSGIQGNIRLSDDFCRIFTAQKGLACHIQSTKRKNYSQ